MHVEFRVANGFLFAFAERTLQDSELLYSSPGFDLATRGSLSTEFGNSRNPRPMLDDFRVIERIECVAWNSAVHAVPLVNRRHVQPAKELHIKDSACWTLLKKKSEGL